MSDLLTMKEASAWASDYLGRDVTTANISYLIQYGRVKKHVFAEMLFLSKKELINYYEQNNLSKEAQLKSRLGDDLNWTLAFDNYKESETTKHVHRLHPYKGKFIPQLVEYFLDDHIDTFKTNTFFKPGDIVLDPFSGSGTTMVQACELGIDSIGIDISEFNCLLSNSKIGRYNLEQLKKEIKLITEELTNYVETSKILEFDNALIKELNIFNNEYFPATDYKYQIRNKLIDEKVYSQEKEKIFLPKYNSLISEYRINISKGNNKESFIDNWFIGNIRHETFFVKDLIDKISDQKIQDILKVTLSRTIRSCRATTHSDLATLLEPVNTTYYCKKHGKICKPLFTILKWWKTYSNDLIKRLQQFNSLRTDSTNICINGDSRTINIIEEINLVDPIFSEKIKGKKIKGIFSSPPYVGVIDYHEQHAYAYDLFNFRRKDNQEIGPLFKGQGNTAKTSYVEGISAVLNNAKKYLIDDFDIFLVANDKHNLYPLIAEKANMVIINQYKRPVLNRTEKDKNAYSEIIFHLKRK